MVRRSKTKEGRTPPLNANNLPGKDPVVGINDFEGVRPEWLMPKRSPCYVFGRKQDLKGERGELTYWCMPIVLSLFFPQFPLLFPLFSLLSFSFLSLVFFYSAFFLLCEYPLFFNLFFRARQGSFYSACRDQFFTTLPLNRICLVWAYLPTTKGFVCVPLTLTRQRQICFIRQSTVALLPATACT